MQQISSQAFLIRSANMRSAFIALLLIASAWSAAAKYSPQKYTMKAYKAADVMDENAAVLQEAPESYESSVPHLSISSG